MGSRERDILGRMKTNCAAIDGSGSYNYDFSATGAVAIGHEPAGLSPRAPGIYIFPGPVRSSRKPKETPLNAFSRVWEVQLDVWVPRTAGTAENACLAIVDAQSDVMRALENDPELNNLVHDIEIDAQTYDGDAIQLPGYGVVTLLARVEYHERRGQ